MRQTTSLDGAEALFRRLGYRLWWTLRGPLPPRRSALDGLVAIGGSPRSGTTLLRRPCRGRPVPPRRPPQHELRYEALVREPEPVLRALLAFLDLPWDDRLLVPVTGAPDPFEPRARCALYASSVGAWRGELRTEEWAGMRPLLMRLRYDVLSQQ